MSDSGKEMLKKQPLRLLENRVWRLYTGGFLLDSFLEKNEVRDGHFPEDWVGSTVIANNPNRQYIREGLSYVVTQERDKRSLISLLQEDPENFLGMKHYQEYGINPGILIKLLDAAMRLPIQVHPNQELANRYFNLPFGKTEAWIILATRMLEGLEPYILLGFREGLSREVFSDLLKSGDSEALEKCLYRIPVREGEVYLIEPGTPHAIGPGNFILEIQEPTDITLRAEKTVGDIVIDQEEAFQGLSLQEYMECYNFQTMTKAKLLKNYRLNPRSFKVLPGYGKEEWLIDYEDTPCFAVRSLEIESFWEMDYYENFYILIVIEGAGCLSGQDFTVKINKGDYYFIPCHLSYQIKNLGVGFLSAITCWPPKLE